jgi:hypothetical protein
MSISEHVKWWLAEQLFETVKEQVEVLEDINFNDMDDHTKIRYYQRASWLLDNINQITNK